MPLERLLGYLEAVAGLLRSQPRCLGCRVPNHRSFWVSVRLGGTTHLNPCYRFCPPKSCPGDQTIFVNRNDAE